MTFSKEFEDVVDLELYPIHNLGSIKGSALVVDARAKLLSTGICQLPGFLRPRAISQTLVQVAGLADAMWYSENMHTVYFTEANEFVAQEHPLRYQVRLAKKALAFDLIPSSSPIKKLYESEVMTKFIGAVLNINPLYKSEDPLDCLEIASFQPGDELGWHFDNSEFSVTLMLQSPSEGGEFEFVPALRSDAFPNYEGLQQIIEGGATTGCIHINAAPGTLTLFRGRHALHRVAVVKGQVTRVNAVLTYSALPGMRLSELTQRLFYGRIV